MIIVSWVIMMLMEMSLTLLLAAKVILLFVYKIQYTTNHDRYCGIDCICNINGSLKIDGSICTSSDPCPCGSTGACACSLGYTNDKCNQCEDGYYDVDGNDSDSSAICLGKCTKADIIAIYT